MRFVCELGDAEYMIDADTPEAAARQAAYVHVCAFAARESVATDEQHTYTVNVAEANEADVPLIAGDDYTVTIATPG